MNRERKLNRLKNYDYSRRGNYFITICVHPELRRKNIFGKINNGEKSHWQRSYYDHIVRNSDSLIRIRKYIINNPVNWERNNTKYN